MKLTEDDILERASDNLYSIELLPKAGDSIFLVIQCIDGIRDYKQIKQQILDGLKALEKIERFKLYISMYPHNNETHIIQRILGDTS